MNGGGMQLHSPPIPKEEPGDLVENFAKTNKKPDVA